jgi:hypothetical protein
MLEVLCRMYLLSPCAVPEECDGKNGSEFQQITGYNALRYCLTPIWIDGEITFLLRIFSTVVKDERCRTDARMNRFYS